jgi:deferrochelatase/peroxidase EfeB
LTEGASALVGGAYRNGVEPFYGTHQGGIVTTPQSHAYFAAFDLVTASRADVEELLRAWTVAAARMSSGATAARLASSPTLAEPDSGDAGDLGPCRLTVNFGFGPGLFTKDGDDRYGLASQRPAALVSIPPFLGDQLLPGKIDGDVTVHACADDPQVAFHAVRQLARMAAGVATISWVQAGFNEAAASDGTPRNLMGFKDGTINPAGPQLEQFVWVGAEGPSWMRGGTYAVFRRIRMTLEHWDSKPLDEQEQAVGRYKASGAPIGATGEFDPLDLQQLDSRGQLVIPLNSHVRVAAPASNGGEMVLRRSYAYNDGVDQQVERWLPYADALLYDAGLLFCVYQRDPRKGFIPIYRNLSENDLMAQFTEHTGSAISALPAGVARAGAWVGEGLFSSS